MINYNYTDGVYSIEHNESMILNNTNRNIVLIYNDINFLETIKSFQMITETINGSTVVIPEYRLTIDNVNFTNWERLDGTIIKQPIFNPYKKYTIYIRLSLSGTEPFNEVTINSFGLKGRLYRAIESGEEVFTISGNEEKIIKPPFVYKIFSIKNIEVISSNNSNLSIQYRYSQNYGRVVTAWEILTKENITTADINPIRFFQIEYLVKSIDGSPVTVYDINLIGEMQNVTKDYYKTNLYGIRENCNCIYLGLLSGTLKDALYNDEKGFGYDMDGNYILGGEVSIEDIKTGDIISDNFYCNPDGTNTNIDDLGGMDNNANQFNPYDTDLDLALIEQMNQDAILTIGHDVIYYHTDPDANGTDYVLNEYQLHHYICHDKIKVTVDDNQFPDDVIGNDYYAMQFADVFTVEISKPMFKKVFGKERSPRVKDVIQFCRTNRIYEVERSYAPRTFNNASIKYRLTLRKWDNSQNVKGVNDLIQDQINSLKNNATIGELFGNYINDNKESVAVKDQILPLSMDNVRYRVNCTIDNEDIGNADLIISKTHYDLGSSENAQAVIYKPIGKELFKSTNLAYTAWFQYIDYKTENNTFNLFTYYDTDTSNGIKFDIINKNRFVITYNSDVYEALVDTVLSENVWYSVVINLDVRNLKMNIHLYKRNIEFEDEKASSTKLLKLWTRSMEMNSNADIFIGGDVNPYISVAEAKITNIRLYKALIPTKEHNKILNENIIREDSDKLIIGDNANKHVILDNYPLTNIIKRDDKDFEN
jgi:hypothetical protein